VEKAERDLHRARSAQKQLDTAQHKSFLDETQEKAKAMTKRIREKEEALEKERRTRKRLLKRTGVRRRRLSKRRGVKRKRPWKRRDVQRKRVRERGGVLNGRHPHLLLLELANRRDCEALCKMKYTDKI